MIATEKVLTAKWKSFTFSPLDSNKYKIDQQPNYRVYLHWQLSLWLDSCDTNFYISLLSSRGVKLCNVSLNVCVSRSVKLYNVWLNVCVWDVDLSGVSPDQVMTGMTATGDPDTWLTSLPEWRHYLAVQLNEITDRILPTYTTCQCVPVCQQSDST